MFLSLSLSQGNGWDCEKCKKKVPAEKTVQLYSTPEVLVVQLKRFNFKVGAGGKIEGSKDATGVDYPLELDLAEFVLQKSTKGERFSLFAVASHRGTTARGHYVAAARSRDRREWFSFDDEKVKMLNKGSQAVSDNGYLLFYERMTGQADGESCDSDINI